MSIQETLSAVAGANDITVLKTENYETNSSLLTLNREKLQVPITFAKKQEKQIVELKAILNAAKNNEKKEIRDNEEDEKKYHLLQRYSHILEKIESLIGIINFDFEDLSFAELGDEIEKLTKTRNTNEKQITYAYYQELFTSTTDSLMIIESGFENGSLTAAEAYAQIKALKLDFKGNLSEVPMQFKDSQYEVEHLLNMYEEAFSQAESSAFITVEKPFSMDEATRIQLQNLNRKTKEIQSNTENLFKRVSEFEPVVDIEALCTQLRDVDNYFKDDWDLDTGSEKVNALENKTTRLYNEQLEKNHTRESLSAEIRELQSQTTKLTKQTKEELVLRQFDQSNTRANAILERLPKLKEMIADPNGIPENLASQIGNCYEAIVVQDEEISLGLSANTEIATAVYDDNLSQLTQDEIYELQDYIKEVSLERSPKLHKDPDEDEENKNN